MIILSSIFVVVLMVLIFYFRLKARREQNVKIISLIELTRDELKTSKDQLIQAQNEAFKFKSDLAKAEGYNDILSKNLKDRDDEIKSIHQSILDLISEKYEVLNELAATYYNEDNSAIEKIVTYRKVTDIISSISINNIDKGKYVDTINKYYDNVYSNFVQEFPNLSKMDYTLFLYLALGLSQKTISLLTNSSVTAVYSRKCRLKIAIRNSNATHKNDFLNILK